MVILSVEMLKEGVSDNEVAQRECESVAPCLALWWGRYVLSVFFLHLLLAQDLHSLLLLVNSWPSNQPKIE